MKTALFRNFTDKEFIGYWDGKSKKFTPGQSLYMPDYLARHFAKHLTNRELLRVDVNGNPVYKDGEKMTSPKKPEDVPLFMELFNKAYVPEQEDEEAMGDKKDDIDALISVANKNREAKLVKKNPKPAETAKESPQEEELDVNDPEKPKAKDKKGKQDPKKPQYIDVPEDDEDDEDSFEGKPVDESDKDAN